MAALDSGFETDTGELHPIDIVEHLAAHRDWEFDRIGDNQIAMAIEGVWRNYSLTLAWSDCDETLRMVATFDMDPPTDRMQNLYELLNLVNDQSWTGAFTYWHQQGLMVFRYGLVLTDGAIAGSGQIDQLVHNAITQCERYYPAFQLTCWGDEPPAKAIDIAIGQVFGHA